MAWYWWLVLAVCAVGIILAILEQRDRYRALDELDNVIRDHRQASYDERLLSFRQRQVEAPISMVLNLPILPKAADGADQSGTDVTSAIRRLCNLDCERLHVVQAPHKIAFVQKFHGKRGVVVREYGRMGQDSWWVRDRRTDNFEATIAELEADDVVETVQCPHCKKHNRIRIVHGQGSWKCGKCHGAL